jgi:hypothetical protein
MAGATKGQTREEYTFDPVKTERRFRDVENGLEYVTKRIDEIADIIKAQAGAKKQETDELKAWFDDTFRGWFQVLLLSGVLGERAWDRIRDRVAKNGEKKQLVEP